MSKCFIAVWLLYTLGPVCIAAVDEHESAARAFALKRLQDPNTFSPSPPSDLNPYKGMSQEEIKQLQDKARANGSILRFQLNGLPSLFVSYKNHKKHGPEKAWHETGRIKYEEHYHAGELVNGIYFDQSGTKLGEITDGAGLKVIFPRPSDMQDQALCFIEYKDSKKHGQETVYRNYEKKIKSRERYYKEGKLHGVALGWRSNGTKNSETHYKDGVEHGKSIHWGETGNVSSIYEYKNGDIKDYTRFYGNGQKSVEVLSEEEKRWHPSGQLMLHIVKKDADTVMSGQSFDLLGNENGKVQNGNGRLIEVDISDYRTNSRLLSRLRVYKDGKTYMPGNLPSIVKPSMDYSHESSNIQFKIEFHAGYCPDWQGGTVAVLLPEGCSSDDELKFAVEGSAAKQDIELGTLEVALPQAYEKWTGSILADINGIVKGQKVRYQQVILKNKVKGKKPPIRPLPNRQRKPRAFQASGKWWKTAKGLPHNTGQILPVNAQIVDSWRLLMPDRQVKEWALYRSPAILLMNKGKAEDWEVVRKDFDYRPLGMVVHGADYILVWGTEATDDISKGIPYHVEKSLDGGGTWSKFEIPEVDCLLGIDEENGVMILSGIRIPKEGMPLDKEWFEIKPVIMYSEDGKTFIEQVGSSLFDFGKGEIITRSVAPNGTYKAFITKRRGMDSTSYSLCFMKAQDEIPASIASVPEKSELVWSVDSNILGIKKSDKYVAYYDVDADKSEAVLASSGSRRREKDKESEAAFDLKVRALLGLQ